MISTGKGVEKILGRKGRRSGKKKREREKLSGGERPQGERVGRISIGKGGNNLRKERGGKILGRKGRRSGRKGLRVESPTGKGWKRS